jgi:glycosyltransferase involved in cell wall biosynthesis
MTAPRVSIAMVAYNHERWIARALESVLEQDFGDFEIVVGDDCSTDKTLAIAREFATQDPRVRLFPSDVNLGGRQNYVRTLNACRGEFINQLDGDDFFLSPNKLSLQVARLDADPTLAGCFAASLPVGEDERALGDAKRPRPVADRFTKADFARYCMSDSAAMIFRRGLFGDFPDWFYTAPQGDWPLHMLNAQHGDFGYVDEVLSAYRIHSGGVWNSKSSVDRVRGNLKCQQAFLLHFSPEEVEEILPGIVRFLLGHAKAMLSDGELEGANLIMDWIAKHGNGCGPKVKEFKLRLWLKVAHLKQPSRQV